MTDHIQVRGARGVGKTLVAESLAHRLAAQGHNVLLVSEAPRVKRNLEYQRVSRQAGFAHFMAGRPREQFPDTVIWDGEPCPFPVSNIITTERPGG